MYTSKFAIRRPLCSYKNVHGHINIEFTKGDYTRNQYGFIRSDFAELQDSNDSLSMARVLQRMQELHDQGGNNQGKSFEDIVAMVKPRWCQSPAELDRFELWCINNAIEQYSKLKQLDDEQKEAIRKAAEQHDTELIAKLRSNIDNLIPTVVDSKTE